MRTENEYRQPVRKNSQEYKQPKNKSQTIMMFISIFFVLLLLFLGFAKIMSPDVDIAIGEDTVINGQSTDNIEYHRVRDVDHRLKILQQEDDVEPEEDGPVKIPEKTVKTTAEPKDETDIIPNTEYIAKPDPQDSIIEEIPVPQSVSVQPAAAQTITARVVVGFYNTQAQADVARGILQDSGLGVSPHIRPMGSGYTLQVGAYSSKESANNLANKLLMNNYPARVIVE